MIRHFAKVSIQDWNNVSITHQTKKSFVLSYPCIDGNNCFPYKLELLKGVYKFECWGSRGGFWQEATPGLGAYTSGIIYISEPQTFFIYIGYEGFFNAVQGITVTLAGPMPGGATDVRLESNTNWWETRSLISRIMVAGGGGGAEWSGSIGGHGGTLTGGNSWSAIAGDDTTTFENPCSGGTQTGGSKCQEYQSNLKGVPYEGTFGSAGKTIPLTHENGYLDYGGFGGGGYYGGTSYSYAFAGSGGSSFISGHNGCNSVNDSYTVDHSGGSVHYSGIVFMKPKMIAGNEDMPLPSTSSSGHYDGRGAFRITLIDYSYQCTIKISPLKGHLSLLFLLLNK